MLQTFHPGLQKLYWTVRDALTCQYPDLHWNFEHSAFSTTTVNLGPQTVCIPHADENDFAFGWGSLRAFGDFDCALGGHVVFWDLGVAFELPPDAEIFIHNTSLQKGKTRYSTTSYSAEGLFEWIH